MMPTDVTYSTDMSSTWVLASGWAMGLLLIQLPAVFILMARLLQGPVRRSPLQPCHPNLNQLGQVSVLVPTLNEVHRLSPCLQGLTRQSYEVREILVIDSHSQDGTPELVIAAQQRDPRIRLLSDEPHPPDWVGRPWALHTGFLHSAKGSEWILGIDADTQPQPGLVAALITAATTEGYDLISLAPRFILKTPGELWLQPALLMTLVYRFGPAGVGADIAERVMANGQCFLCRRSVLTAMGGYQVARQSFCDDVTLARQAAARGAKVGFWDGAHVLKVRMYEGAWETWQEWGRSLDLKDAATPYQTWGDLWFLTAVQGLPWLVLPGLAFCLWKTSTLPLQLALGCNLSLVIMRLALQWAITPSYDLNQARHQWTFWLSALADPLAVLRIFLSVLRRPTQWRGRQYPSSRKGWV